MLTVNRIFGLHTEISVLVTEILEYFPKISLFPVLCRKVDCKK